MAMASNVDARLARLEGLIHAQGNTIAEQARTIADQASTIARLSSDTQAHAAVDRHHDRQLVKLSRAVFREGEWVEQGTIDRRARSEQSWKLGGEGDKKWEWQVRPPPPSSILPITVGQVPALHRSRWQRLTLTAYISYRLDAQGVEHQLL